ncbi:MAG TPA: carboxypeptidase regulatory-like domain-containing protein, partial [Bryobacteraceae bacterium]|nr:carboxypeptidase regulatory-like domain-containing protein [Bryobacteraceae bacterium]
MRFLRLTLGVCACAWLMFAQSDRGTITGTVSDPAGAVVPNATVDARNTQTGAVYTAATSGTGNYTLAELPTGTYELAVTVAGFKKFLRQNIILPATQTVRIDASLEVGSASESVTINAEAPLLQTENGMISQNETSATLDNLPVYEVGTDGPAGTGLRNPYAVVNLLPGSTFVPDSAVRINGTPANTQAMRIEGQDSTSGIFYTQSWVQPSVDAVQEFAVQTSNFAAEYGQAGGAVVNLTMKSGTNQFHGSLYEYFSNDALNAAEPFTGNQTPDGSNYKPVIRRNDFGGTIGGPVIIPHLYNGHDKTFFFFNYEMFRASEHNQLVTTVPTPLMRTGNFSEVPLIPTGVSDPLTGAPIFANQIFDPNSSHSVTNPTTGQTGIERTPFPGNIVPSSYFDPVAQKIQNFIPLPNRPGLINNYVNQFTNPRHSMVPSFKVDQNLSDKQKLSVYYSYTQLDTPSNDGLPYPITTARGYNLNTTTSRVNYENTLTPTLLFHAGVGLLWTNYNEVSPAYNVESGLGLQGTYDPNLFPSIQGLFSFFGGMGGFFGSDMGGYTHVSIENPKPTGNVSLTWVKGNHTMKFGGEVMTEGYLNQNNTYATPWIVFGAAETSNPAFNGLPLALSPGFPYASFLMGAVDSGYTSVPTDTRLGKHALAFYAQDSWKVTRKFTLDYGLRYDYQTYLKEENGTMPNLSPSTPNPGAGNLPGGTIFEATCNCNFSHNYPFAFGPRLGGAYQITPKTVFRGGIGVIYSRTSEDNFQSYAVGANTPYNAPAYGTPAYYLQNGLPYKITYPNFSAGQYPVNGVPANTLNFFDQNAGRPGRAIQWNISIQREIIPNLTVQAAYVGNRGAWWQSNVLNEDNAILPSTLAAHGFNVTNPADDSILTGQLGSYLGTAVGNAHGLTLPYSNFPLTESVAQSLRPYPEYTGILRLWDPVGDTWYNALQLTVTKRFSHGLQFDASYTYSKQQELGAEGDANFFQYVNPAVNDVFNREQNKYLSGYDQPNLFVFSGSYITPKTSRSKFLSAVVSDWQIGSVLRYASGMLIQVPTANNGLNAVLFRSGFSSTGGTFVNRIPG